MQAWLCSHFTMIFFPSTIFSPLFRGHCWIGQCLRQRKVFLPKGVMQIVPFVRGLFSIYRQLVYRSMIMIFDGHMDGNVLPVINPLLVSEPNPLVTLVYDTLQCFLLLWLSHYTVFRFFSSIPIVFIVYKIVISLFFDSRKLDIAWTRSALHSVCTIFQLSTCGELVELSR